MKLINIRKEYPKPQFMRQNWRSLDGQWDFSFDPNNQGILDKWYNEIPQKLKIEVPFTYETELSGINDKSHHSIVWYQKEIEIEQIDHQNLVFEGVDYASTVWINGNMIGNHTGAYERFEFNITNFLKKGNNKIIVRVEDSLDCEQPRGKQRWLKNNFGCWYVQTTGIWKSVWIEYLESDTILSNVKMTPDLDNDKIIFEPKLNKNLKHLNKKLFLEILVTFDNQLVNSKTAYLNHESIKIDLDTRVEDDACWGTKVWSPEMPNLYEVEFKLIDEHNIVLDTVSSYFGMRKISISGGKILLNNHELYQRLILDQGYWKESGLTPPSVDALELDINLAISLGYNGIRKHQKIEDERFLYLCDLKGILVWSEMASTYTFNDKAMKNFTKEWLDIIEQNYNHPSIITWVPFNESWGIKDIKVNENQQKFTESIYYLTKAIDSNRPVITNDGWEHTISDIITLHDYEEFPEDFEKRYESKEEIIQNKKQFNKDLYAFANGYTYNNQPIIISEFGGIAFSTESTENWGYGSHVTSEEEFLKRFSGMHKVIQQLEYSVGYCYTQLTDVEQEINGLLDTKRIAKVDIEAIKKINQNRLK